MYFYVQVFRNWYSPLSGQQDGWLTVGDEYTTMEDAAMEVGRNRTSDNAEEVRIVVYMTPMLFGANATDRLMN